MGEPALEAVISGGLEVSDQTCLGLLATLGSGHAERVLKLLDSPDARVRRLGAEALGRIKDPQSALPVSGALSDSEPAVQVAVAMALGEIGNSEVCDILITELNSNSDKLREAVAEALGKLGDSRAEPALRKLLGDSHSSVRCEAARAFGELRSATSVADLRLRLTDSCTQVIVAAIDALGFIGDNIAIQDLIGLLKSRHRVVREAAARALGRIGDVRAIEPLIALFTRKKSIEAAKSLGLLHAEDAVDLLANSLTEVVDIPSSSPREIWQALWSGFFVADAFTFRTGIAEALGDLRSGSRQAPGELVSLAERLVWRDCLMDGWAADKSVVARALGKIGDPGTLDLLLKGVALWHRHDWYEDAVSAVAMLRDRRAVEPLKRWFLSGDRPRGVFGEALARIGDDDTIEFLGDFITGNRVMNYGCLCRIVRSLGSFGSAQAVPYLKNLSESCGHSQDLVDIAEQAIQSIEERTSTGQPSD